MTISYNISQVGLNDASDITISILSSFHDLLLSERTLETVFGHRGGEKRRLQISIEWMSRGTALVGQQRASRPGVTTVDSRKTSPTCCLSDNIADWRKGGAGGGSGKRKKTLRCAIPSGSSLD